MSQLNRVLILDNLSKRGINLISMQCAYYLTKIEEVDHLFFKCDYAKDMWWWFYGWYKILEKAPSSFNFMVQMAVLLKHDKFKWKLFWDMVYVVIWATQKSRNDCIYKHRK